METCSRGSLLAAALKQSDLIYSRKTWGTVSAVTVTDLLLYFIIMERRMTVGGPLLAHSVVLGYCGLQFTYFS